MTEIPQRPARLFTLEEANARLPLVRVITSDLSDLSREISERRARLQLLTRDRETDAKDVYSAELQEMQQLLEKDRVRLREYVEELLELGVEPKGGIEGLIDFPAILNGKMVYLCWKLGEPSVQYWHDLDAGYAGRQVLPKDFTGNGAQPIGKTN